MNHSAATGTGRDMMDGNKLNELRELVEFLKANDIAEFDMEQDDLKVRIKFAGEPAAPGEEALHEVKSPIVGTFYESPSPGAPSFVKVGDQVEVGQVLCIVEAMKLMNEIESDVAGEVVRQIASSGQPVEYGQALFAIRARIERRK